MSFLRFPNHKVIKKKHGTTLGWATFSGLIPPSVLLRLRRNLLVGACVYTAPDKNYRVIKKKRVLPTFTLAYTVQITVKYIAK